MKRIGITGQRGFVGYHIYQTINLLKEEFELVDFDRTFFTDEKALDAFTGQCDVIVHLAALNRHKDPQVIYETNTRLVHQLIESLERTSSKAHVLMSSSTQEERENLYGKSKRDGRLAFADWANKSDGKFTGLIIPNVFGPFGQPFYNSVVATFCYQIARGEIPKIDVDGDLKLIYVGDLVEKIIEIIRNNDSTHELLIPNSAEAKVSEILVKLKYFKKSYQEKDEIPALNSDFEFKLFNTYRCYIDVASYFPKRLAHHVDARGGFVEIARQGIPGQTSFSTTLPEITRGNHYHTRKIERFAVIKGKALIQLRQVGTEDVFEFILDGNYPAYVDMPIWYTHNIKNIGADILYTIFWIDEPYDPTKPDTYYEIV